MSLEKNKVVVRKMFEAFNKRNLALLDELIAPDYVDQLHQLRGLDDVKQFLTTLIKGFPDLLMTIEDIIAEGDKVWVRVKVAGTNTGEFRGEPPSGKKYIYTDVHNFRIVEGKIIEDIMVSAHT